MHHSFIKMTMSDESQQTHAFRTSIFSLNLSFKRHYTAQMRKDLVAVEHKFRCHETSNTKGLFFTTCS